MDSRTKNLIMRVVPANVYGGLGAEIFVDGTKVAVLGPHDIEWLASELIRERKRIDDESDPNTPRMAAHTQS